MAVHFVSGIVVLVLDQLVPLIDCSPVDDVPKGLHVIGPHILVFEIISVLPDIDDQKRACVPGHTQLVAGAGRGDRPPRPAGF